MLYPLPFLRPIYKYIGYLFCCFFTVTSIIMFFVFMDNISVLIEIFQYKALFCLLLAFLDGVLHTVKYIFCVLFSRLLFFLSGGCYSVILVQ